MYQYEKRLDCRALGKEIKRRRKAKTTCFNTVLQKASNLHCLP